MKPTKRFRTNIAATLIGSAIAFFIGGSGTRGLEAQDKPPRPAPTAHPARLSAYRQRCPWKRPA